MRIEADVIDPRVLGRRHRGVGSIWVLSWRSTTRCPDVTLRVTFARGEYMYSCILYYILLL